MKKNLNILLFLIFLICAVSVSATQYSASNAVISCSSGWEGSPLKAVDDNFNTSSNTTPGSPAYCNLLFPKILGFQNATLTSRSSTDAAYSVAVPASCFYKSRINITFYSSYDVSANSIFIYCNNGTGLQLVTGNGAGDSVALKTRFYEMYINVSATGIANCPALPNPPMYREDSFSYTDSITDCYWSAYQGKLIDVFPTANQLCYDVGLTPEPAYFFFNRQNNVQSNVWTQEYDILLNNASSLINYDFVLGTESLTGNTALTLVFGIGGVYYIKGNSYYPICQNCTDVNVASHIKVVVFTALATDQKIFNGTSGLMQTAKPNTFAVSVDGADYVFDIPLSVDSAVYFLPYSSEFTDIAYGFCLDNYELYGGVNYMPGQNNTGIAPPNSLTLGEKCQTDTQCISQFCNYLKSCALKNFGASCVNSYECMSKKCSFSLCTKPTLWQEIDTAKSEGVGNDKPTNNLISIIISLAVAIGIGVLLFKFGAGFFAAAGSGIIFLVLMFFFVMVGWLDVWILVAIIIGLVLIAALLFVLATPGG